MRIYRIALNMGVSAKQVLTMCRSMGIDAANSGSKISNDEVERLLAMQKEAHAQSTVTQELVAPVSAEAPSAQPDTPAVPPRSPALRPHVSKWDGYDDIDYQGGSKSIW